MYTVQNLKHPQLLHTSTSSIPNELAVSTSGSMITTHVKLQKIFR